MNKKIMELNEFVCENKKNIKIWNAEIDLKEVKNRKNLSLKRIKFWVGTKKNKLKTMKDSILLDNF